MIEIPLYLKIVFSIIWDILDFTIFRLPAFGTFADFLSGFIAIGLYGSTGVIAFWEVIDVTDQADAFIPTLTIIGLMQLFKDNELPIRRPQHV